MWVFLQLDYLEHLRTSLLIKLKVLEYLELILLQLQILVADFSKHQTLQQQLVVYLHQKQINLAEIYLDHRVEAVFFQAILQLRVNSQHLDYLTIKLLRLAKEVCLVPFHKINRIKPLNSHNTSKTKSTFMKTSKIILVLKTLF